MFDDDDVFVWGSASIADDFELKLLRQRRFSVVSLGARTLRADTACVALLAALRAGRDAGES